MAKKIRQQVASGKNFEGVAPINPPAVDDGTTVTYAEEDVGGEFSPGAGTLRNICLKGGNQSSTEFKVIFGAGGEEQLLACPFPDRQVSWSGEVALLAGDKVIVTTKNGEHAMSCDVVVA